MARYYSTRDEDRHSVSFADALLKGLAPDGGLYVPDCVPNVPDEAWQGSTSLNALGAAVLERWLGAEVDAETLTQLVDDALNFPVPDIPLDDGIFVLELFHGPTLSFKDVGARTMARLMSRFLAERGERRTILVATSGDTGSAVADGFAGQDNIDVVLLYPKGKVSEVQEQQLIVKRKGVRTFAVEGNFDDCQRLVKEAFVSPKLSHLPLSSANSINIGRLLPQSLYYFWASVGVSSRYNGTMSPPIFCVPSGNLGNLTGGVLAARAGLNVPKFIAAHNANDFFPNYLHKLLKAYAFSPTVSTASNAMDVGAPSNFERLYALLNEEMQGLIWGSSVTDEVTKTRMKEVYERTGYVACPHTAVGLEAAYRYRDETGNDAPIVVLATAHPAKFPEVVAEALGIPAPKEERLEVLWDEETQVERLEPNLAALREALLAA